MIPAQAARSTADFSRLSSEASTSSDVSPIRGRRTRVPARVPTSSGRIFPRHTNIVNRRSRPVSIISSHPISNLANLHCRTTRRRNYPEHAWRSSKFSSRSPPSRPPRLKFAKNSKNNASANTKIPLMRNSPNFSISSKPKIASFPI